MSLLDELTAELRTASNALPLPTLRRAIGDVRRANEFLVRAAQLGSPLQPSLARLGSATRHLENGAGLLMRAQDEVDGYLGAIGGHRTAHLSVAGQTPAEQSDSWWAERIAQLTGCSDAGCDDPARTADELLDRVGRAVVANDRSTLHRQLVGAGAGLGSSLSATAMSALRRLTTEMLGRSATPDDLPTLRAEATVGDLLPGLPGDVTATLTSLVCRSADRSRGLDPTDLAVGAAVLASRFAQKSGQASGRALA
jgi:hypothetical protein